MKQAKAASARREQARAWNRRKAWLPVLLMAAGALVMVAVVALSANRAGAANVQPARSGARMSDFALDDIHGERVRLRDYAGQVVLVNAWATWCPPCRAEMPALNAYYQAHAAEGFVILAVNAGDAPEDAAAFARDYGLEFPVLLDTEMELLDGLNIRSFPTSILVGRDGVVKTTHTGMLTPEQIEAKVGPLLAEPGKN